MALTTFFLVFIMLCVLPVLLEGNRGLISVELVGEFPKHSGPYSFTSRI